MSYTVNLRDQCTKVCFWKIRRWSRCWEGWKIGYIWNETYVL